MPTSPEPNPLLDYIRQRSADAGVPIAEDRLENFAQSLEHLRQALKPLRDHAASRRLDDVFGGSNDAAV